MCELLVEAGGQSQRLVSKFDCLKQLNDVIRFILTLFVHEQLCEYRNLYIIMDTA